MTKPLRPGILLLISLIFVLRTVLVTKLLPAVFFLSTSSAFFSKFCLSMFYWLMWIKVVFSNLFTFILSVLYFVFLTTSLFTTSLNIFESLGTFEHLNHLLLFLNYSHQLNYLSISNLLMPSLSTLAFKAIKLLLAVELNISAPAASFNS